jgi:hypothetical protein
MKVVPLDSDAVLIFETDVGTTDAEYRTIFAKAEAWAGTGRRVRIMNRVRYDLPEPEPTLSSAMNWARIANSEAIDRYAVLGADSGTSDVLSATNVLFPNIEIRGFSFTEEADALAWLEAPATR